MRRHEGGEVGVKQRCRCKGDEYVTWHHHTRGIGEGSKGLKVCGRAGKGGAPRSLRCRGLHEAVGCLFDVGIGRHLKAEGDQIVEL